MAPSKIVRGKTWPSTLREYARNNKAAATGLGLALAIVILLLAQSLALIATGNAPVGFRNASLGGLTAFATTALGAMPAFFLRGIAQKVEDSLLGMAAGMMLAASAFSLLIPGLAAGTEMLDSKPLSAGIVVFGMALGVLLILGLERFTPHQHLQSGPCGPGHERVQRIWLFVFAVALHNLPEGMAIGVSFAQNDLSVGLPLTTAIAL